MERINSIQYSYTSHDIILKINTDLQIKRPTLSRYIDFPKVLVYFYTPIVDLTSQISSLLIFTMVHLNRNVIMSILSDFTPLFTSIPYTY